MHQKKGILYYLQIFSVISVVTLSCSTERVIPFSQVGTSRPEIIRLKNNTEYRIYSYQVSNRVSGDTLVLYSRRDNRNIARIREASIDQIVDKKIIRSDSPAFYILFVIPFVFIGF